jgi:hypothetical protein
MVEKVISRSGYQITMSMTISHLEALGEVCEVCVRQNPYGCGLIRGHIGVSFKAFNVNDCKF